MNYRVLGKSGLKVSEVSIGCWAIGGPSWLGGKDPAGWSGADDTKSLEGLQRAFELGINHFDTADVYGDGHSEQVVGRFLKTVPRDRVIIASKTGWFRGTSPHTFHPVHVRNQLEQTLSNLGTDCLDIYYFHNAYFGDGDMYLAGAVEVFQRAKKEGKIRVIAQSAEEYGEYVRVAQFTQPEIIQLEYNALDPRYDGPKTDLFAWAEERSIGMVCYSPLAQGLLLDKYDPEHPPQFGEGDMRRGRRWKKEGLLDLRRKLAKVKEKYGASTGDLVKVAVKYCLARSPLAVAIPGFKNSAQVDMNAASSDGCPFTKEDIEFIRKALRG